MREPELEGEHGDEEEDFGAGVVAGVGADCLGAEDAAEQVFGLGLGLVPEVGQLLAVEDVMVPIGPGAIGGDVAVAGQTSAEAEPGAEEGGGEGVSTWGQSGIGIGDAGEARVGEVLEGVEEELAVQFGGTGQSAIGAEDVAVGDGEAPPGEALGDDALLVIAFIAEGEGSAALDLEESLRRGIGAKLKGDAVFPAIANGEGERGVGQAMAEVELVAEGGERFAAGEWMGLAVEGESFEEVVKVASGEEDLHAFLVELVEDAQEMVVGERAHAAGDPDAEGGVVAVILEGPAEGEEAGIEGLGYGLGGEEFAVGLVVAAEGEGLLAILDGGEQGTRVEAAAEGDGDGAESGEGATSDGEAKGVGEFGAEFGEGGWGSGWKEKSK